MSKRKEIVYKKELAIQNRIKKLEDWTEDNDLEIECSFWQVNEDYDFKIVYTITNKYDRSVGIPRVELSPNFESIDKLLKWWEFGGRIEIVRRLNKKH